MTFRQRTHTCGELREGNIGERVVLNGWVDTRRDLGGVIFIDMRDRYGITQVVFEPQFHGEAHEIAKDLRGEFVISIEGEVRHRPENTENPNIPTGMVDVMADKIVILNKAITTPFLIEDGIDTNEEIRLKYRYLDLRRPEMQRNLLLRHKLYQVTRNCLSKKDFIEIETPYLMKSTPEGARDYLVPSRIHKGKFYALPQSPQTYKQLLMVSGYDRYFQIVKCFRDEAFRSDRQPEFTQIDMEMSFVDIDDVFAVVEDLMKDLYKELWGKELKTPIPRLSYEDAMQTYGTDKPDMRFGLEMHNLNSVFENCGFKVFTDALESGGVVTGLKAPACGDYTRNQLDVLTDFVKKLGAGGLIWIRVKEEGLEAPTMKFFTDEEKANLTKALEAETGDLMLLLTGPKYKTLSIMGMLRLEMARRLDAIKPDAEPKLLWVKDFPLLEWDEETERYYAMHHPFTSPHPEDIPLLDTDPGNVRARAYDLVLNGYEIAGGSIRIHQDEVQKKMFKSLGIDEEEAQEKFGHLLDAFKYGAPPHGGIAFGVDRMAMIFANGTSIRDVIAFPKTASAVSLMDDCPSEVTEKQLKELHIKIR